MEPRYSDDELLVELRRVAAQLGDEPVTADRFADRSEISPHTLRRRFGSWRQALEAARLGTRYSGRRVTVKMRRSERRLSAEEVVERLRTIADGHGRSWIRKIDVHRSDHLGMGVVLARFGTWPAAVTAAGLSQAPQVTRPAVLRKVTDAELFANLQAITDQLGRIPQTRELRTPLSQFSYHVYLRRFGAWAAAVDAWRNPTEKPSAEVDTKREPPAQH